MVRNRAVRGGDLPAQRPLGNAVQAGGTRGAAIPFSVDFTYQNTNRKNGPRLLPGPVCLFCIQKVYWPLCWIFSNSEHTRSAKVNRST